MSKKVSTNGSTTKVLLMSPSNMKELLDYVKQAKQQRAAEHRRKFAHHGRCSGLTDKEYTRIKHSQKSSFPKVRKFTHHAMWRETSKQYSVEQLKQIKKCTI
jgi:hypothetical protein